MNRTYEIMFIVRPDVEEADLDKLIEGFSGNVTNGGGEVKHVEKMGRRRLAYTVRKFNDGFYVLLTVAAAGSLIAEIERRLRVSEQVIKFITVRMDEEEKRLAKVKALRDTKVKRSAQPAAAPVAAPVAVEETPAAEAPVVAETPAAETAAV
jgi:small subunit ribosomal protein S6